MLSGDAQFANWVHMRVNHSDQLKTHALKVSHHKSKHGNFLEALETIDPTYAIISAGTRDLKAFPHKYTMDSLKEILGEDRIFITREVGNVVIKSKGSRILKILTEK